MKMIQVGPQGDAAAAGQIARVSMKEAATQNIYRNAQANGEAREHAV